MHVFHYVPLSHVHYVTILFRLWMTTCEWIPIITKCSLGATACIFAKAILIFFNYQTRTGFAEDFAEDNPIVCLFPVCKVTIALVEMYSRYIYLSRHSEVQLYLNLMQISGQQ